MTKVKTDRLEALKMIISSQELGSQSELLTALDKEGFHLTQATLSRDLKQLKVAKAASMNGKYVYVLPNETMYRRVKTPRRASEMQLTSGFLSINFSGIWVSSAPGRDMQAVLHTTSITMMSLTCSEPLPVTTPYL